MTLRTKCFLCLAVLASTGLFAKVKRRPRSPAAASQRSTAASTAASIPAGSRQDEGDFVTEKRSDGTTVKYKKKTTYDFEGANIDGMYNKPSGSYISNIKDVKARSIIRIRENFDAEVIDSSRSVK